MIERQEDESMVLGGKVAIVTGGGRGVGRGISLALAAARADVVVLGRTEEPLIETVAEIEQRGGRARWIRADITQLADVDAAIELALNAFGGIDVLINNATVVPHGHLLDLSEEVVNEAWAAGPFAAWRLMVRCHPHMVARGGGAVVNVSSESAIHQNVAGLGAYGAIKAALNAFSRVAAMEWAADGIRVNAIMPIAMSDAYAAFLEHEPSAVDAIPLRRVGDPEIDVGRAVVFLCGPDAGYITGAMLGLDGGSSYIR